MDEEIRRTIGSRESLEIFLNLFYDEDHPRSLAWGEMLVSLNNEPVWCAESSDGQDAPVAWAWLELLEFLGDKWPWLLMEEKYPISITPLHPGKMRHEAEKRWESMGEEQFLEEDERLFRFEGRHDLAMGLKGIFLPSLFILRQGKKAWVYSDSVRLFVWFQEVIDTLSELGDCLANYIEDCRDSRAARAVQRWRDREQRAKELFWELRTGMTSEIRSKLEQGQSPRVFWETDTERVDFDNELLAAARLSAGVVRVEEQQAILKCIKDVPFRQVQRLEAVAGQIASGLDENMRPYEQGYAAAKALRRILELDPENPAEPEQIFGEWDVEILEIRLDRCPLDAVAAWGPRHGPAVILNTGEGARPAHEHGRRSTLAHEICHLLVDRKGALPFAEALGGHTALYVEQRARAFAAEFLLPEETGVQYVRRYTDLQEVLEKMSADFAVSIELAALQIKNSRLYFDLNGEEQLILSRNTENHIFYNL
ncbi:MAG: ImmA/IrrE family metallo-endopeptidase [Thermodesulfobacteriota bacterium]|nr:ImmA/IrrE family metallo-endopeptidase [Thermodesulfobacteriota bacterium]